MAFVYRADEEEARIIREAFGPTVAEVVFYDPEFPDEDEPWCVLANDADGKQIGERTQKIDEVEELFEIPGNRDETVKFWLTLPAA